MEFSIIFDPPTCTKQKDPLDSTLGEAIETIFSTGEKIQMVWDGYAISLSWTEDISQIWRDILIMLRQLRVHASFIIHWPSASFFATWDLTLAGDVLTINSEWEAICGGKGALLQLKESKSEIIVERDAFVQEWHCLLKSIRDALEQCDYNPSELYGFQSLIDELDNYRGKPHEELGQS